jgi:hypothetical protein
LSPALDPDTVGAMRRRFARLSLGAPLFSLAAACGPFITVVDDAGSESEVESPTETSNDPPVMTATVTVTVTSTTTTPMTTSVDDDTSPDTTDPEASYCAQACRIVADCLPPMTDPTGYACIAGFCEFTGRLPPCDETNCPSVAGFACASVDGISLCVIACTEVGGECDPFEFMCTGVTDAGMLYCEPPPCNGFGNEGEPCFLRGFGQLGVCTDGLCTCTDDSQCTALGWACNFG